MTGHSDLARAWSAEGESGQVMSEGMLTWVDDA